MLVVLLMCVVRFVAWHKFRILMNIKKNTEQSMPVFYFHAKLVVLGKYLDGDGWTKVRQDCSRADYS